MTTHAPDGVPVAPLDFWRRDPGRPIVKVCGVRSPEVAVAVAEAGADLIGLNFAAASRRRTDPGTAATMASAVRSGARGRAPIVVGIFVEQGASEIAAIARMVGLDAVQLSGECNPATCRDVHDACGLPVVAVARLADDGSSHARAHALAEVTGVAAVLVDAPGTVGGAGHPWNYALARDLVDTLAKGGVRVLVAGGLSPDNVADALRTTGAWGADVATGVETGGQTDPDRVRAFIEGARLAWRGP